MALGLVLVVGDLIVGTHRPGTSAGSAALRHAAVVVSEQSTPRLAPGQFLYTETRSLYRATVYQGAAGSSRLVPVAQAQYLETEQAWADVNGNGRGLLTRGPLQYSSEADQSAWDATAEGRTFSSEFNRSVVEPSLRQLVPDVSDLSTDPSTLAQEVANGFDGSNVDSIPAGPSAVFQRGARLLVGPDSGMTSSLDSAIYQVLADQPGVTLLGTTTDESGRQGTGISVSSPSGVSELIIDAASGSALEVRYSPPPSSIASPLNGPTTHCIPAIDCGSSASQLTPNDSFDLVTPVWTDSVTTEIVSSEGATGPVGEPNT